MAKLGVTRLAAMMFFTVSGGPYGLEEMISGLGWRAALAAVLIVPLIWALPTALLTAELAAEKPSQSGYYAWVRDALGERAGAMAAWISLAMSVFDMAIYPAMAIAYLAKIIPALADPATGWFTSAALIFFGAAASLFGSSIVSAFSVASAVALLLPFALMIKPAFTSSVTADASAATVMSAGLLCMWNYMGWDNSSTLSADVRCPQKTYPRALALALALVTLSYAGATLIASRYYGVTSMSTGSWVDVAAHMCGAWAGIAVALCGAVCGFNMFCALVSSYAQLPAAMARDGLLPSIFAKTTRRGAPYVSIAVTCCAYAVSSGAGIKRLMELDVLLYGALFAMQAAALLKLSKIRTLKRAARLCYVCGVPICLLLTAVWVGRRELGMWSLSSAELGGIIIAICAIAAFATSSARRSSSRD